MMMNRMLFRVSKGEIPLKRGWLLFPILLFLISFPALPLDGAAPDAATENGLQGSDHFDGDRYFNPWIPQPLPGQAPGRMRFPWILRFIFGNDRPEWPKIVDLSPGPPPTARVPKGALSVTPVGHATFLIQMDGQNILTDPIWSERCSPISWAGPRRRTPPGIRFEELPPIDAVLVSHNHYDHLDLPTLSRLAEKGVLRAVVPLGNLDLVRGTGIPNVEERDWWQTVRLSPEVTVTLVPAQHFSSRTLWDRNETLWGGFVVSGPSGNLFFAGDTGYGPHFREIARRFAPIRAAILPISPFRPREANTPLPYSSGVHMGPAEAVQAHLDLGAPLSIAAHFQVFQLGADGFEDALDGLTLALQDQGIDPDDFVAPKPGRAIHLPAGPAEARSDFQPFPALRGAD
jgi:L-ascorbate metabolism protein UlaG (beta-lactamase superfamily)